MGDPVEPELGATASEQPGSSSPSGSLEERAEVAAAELGGLESARMDRLNRLRAAERRLTEAARRRFANSRRRAIRQIENERQRLGSELHTGVGQMLAAIRLQVNILEANLPERTPAVRQTMERISAMAEDALEQIRSVSRRLHPPAWQRLTLDAALRQLCEMTGVAGGFETVLRIEPLDFEPGLEVRSLFYRTAQEALSNIIRHSKATRIQLILQQVRDRLVLQVRDNGVGFPAARARTASAGESGASQPHGIGLESIREQARTVGGKLLIQSGRFGTTLEVSVRTHRNFP